MASFGDGGSLLAIGLELLPTQDLTKSLAQRIDSPFAAPPRHAATEHIGGTVKMGPGLHRQGLLEGCDCGPGGADCSRKFEACFVAVLVADDVLPAHAAAFLGWNSLDKARCRVEGDSCGERCGPQFIA